MNNKHEFSLTVYLLIVVALSWPFQIAGQIWAIDLRSLWLLNAGSMTMVGVATFITGRYVFRDGFQGGGWNWGRAKHHFAVIGFVCVLWVVPSILDLAVGTASMPDGITAKQVIITLAFVSPFSVLVPGFGEEFGWRGYMLPRLAKRFNGRKAVLVHGVIWWAWHLPILVGAGVQAGIAAAQEGEMPVSVPTAATISALVVVIAGAIPAILHGVVFAYVWMRSGSLAVATVYHAAYDGFRDSVGAIIGVGPVAGVWATTLLTATGIVLLWKADWSTLSNGSPLKET